MSRLVKRVSKKEGLPAGTLVHTGEERKGPVRITVLTYDEQGCECREAPTIEEELLRAGRAVTWIKVDGIHDVEVVQRVGETFQVHPLVLEDIVTVDQRPKLEDLGNCIFVVLKAFSADTDVLEEQVSLILGPGYVISFQEGERGVLEGVQQRIEEGRGRIRRMGADFLAYSLLDAIVDGYFAFLEGMGEEIESLEEELVTDPQTQTLQAIHRLKREMILLRRAVWPLREVVGNLERWDSPLIEDSTRMFLRDVYDHAIQVIDTVEALRDVLSGMLDIYLSSISNRMNEVMKVLTIFATIFIPLTFVAGVYGMNFEFMPELGWRWSYPILWLVLIAVAVVMLVYFRRKRWL
jgi:magnesium transporter